MRKLYIIILSLFLFSNLQAQNWVSLSTPQYNDYEIKFIDRYTGFIFGTQGFTQYLMTANGGLTWQTKSFSGNYFLKVTTIQQIGSKLYVGAGGEFNGYPQGSLYISVDGGNSWSSFQSSCSFTDIQFINTSTGIAGAGVSYSFESDGGIFKTTNGGVSWEEKLNDSYIYLNVDFPNEMTGNAAGYHWADFGYNHDKVVKTTNGGENWITIKFDSTEWFTPRYKKMQFLNLNTGYLLFDNLFKTTNGGQSWTEPYAFPSDSARSFHFINENTGWISGRLDGKIYKTIDGGSTWVAQNIPVGNISGETFFLDETHGWARANGTTVLTTDTTGLMGISISGSEVPQSFRLHQNYPNPFNPNTSIKFEIPSSVRGERSKVKLSVYDIAGKEVGVLVNSEFQPGVYEYNFDGTGLVSGVYFYRIAVQTDKLTPNNFSETKRMVLVK